MPDLRKGYWVALLPCERTDGTHAIAFIARRTYSIPKDAAVLEPLPDDDQPPFLAEDRFDAGDVMTAPPTLEVELVPEKARADVLVVGKAYAPGGKALPEFECSLRLGSKQVTLRILGPRKCIFVPPRKQEGKLIPQPPRFSDPEPLKELVLTLSHAYGGKSRVIPDDETLAMQHHVEGIMAQEAAVKQKQEDEAQADQKQDDARKENDAKEAALFAALGAKAAPKDEKLKFGDGSEGYDADGVRLWGASASKDGTAVLDLEEFEKVQLADQAAAQRRAQEEAEAQARKGHQPKRRRNAQGEALEADEGVEILTDEALAAEQDKTRKELEEQAKVLAQAAAIRATEAVLQNEGTKVLDGWDAHADESDWSGDLKAGFVEGDAAELAARKKRIAERKKLEDEALAEFPELPCPTNPFGKGFLASPHQLLIDRLELPQIEDPATPLTPRDLLQDVMALDKVPMPTGFTPWPRHARPRIDHAGPYPSGLKDWQKDLEKQKRALDLKKKQDVLVLRELERRSKPTPMRAGYYNSAPTALQWSQVTGDEDVTLTNLTKDGTLYFRLPGKVLEAELDRGRGIERKDLTLDTLVIEPDERKVTLLWRTHYPIQDFDELGTYPQCVGWVLDLDVQARKDRNWAESLKNSQGDGTLIMDPNEAHPESEPYWLQSTPEETPGKPEDQALDLEKMGTYRRVNDDGWVKEASDGTMDISADEKAKKEEEAYVAEKLAAVKGLEEQEKADAARREAIAKAAQEKKPVPPPTPPPPPPGKAKAPKPSAAKKK